jgi:predicted nucleic acid-binding protein
VIVIDASSLAKYILREENWETVRHNLVDDPFSIDLALAEVSNAVWKHHSVYGKISLEDALLMFNALKEAQEIIVFEPLGKYLSPAQKISVEEKVSIYDALYIAQAQKYGRILTSDKKQSEIAQKLEIEVEFIE